VQNLIDTILIKIRCRIAQIEKLDAGPKGMSVTFRNNRFANPEALIGLINKKSGIMQVTGDQKVVVRQTLPQSKRVNAARKLVDEIVALL
jgi:transcription-repair coupling factor (superfamily II helicase)